MTDFSTFLKTMDDSSSIVVLTGAGISTLSGIPDFRSSGGLYSQKFGSLRVEELLDIDFFRKHPDEFYLWAKDTWYKMHTFRPNIVHQALVELEKTGRLRGIYTQNIDGLHTLAGSKAVYELHGTINTSSCLKCGEGFTYDEIEEQVREGVNPKCPHCGGTIKPDIVFYGEGLDGRMLAKGEKDFREADLCIVLGSSLVVNPAASLPYYAARYGRKLCIVNRDETYLDQYADFLFKDLEEFALALDRHLCSQSL